MSKKLNESAMQDELSSSAFFQPAEKAPPEPVLVPKVSAKPKKWAAKSFIDERGSSQASSDASMLASHSEKLIESIRVVVKDQGKEVSFVRMTPREKEDLVDIVYTYKRQGIKTSETEINRIAVNFMLEDYKANGSNSMLAKVLHALAA